MAVIKRTFLVNRPFRDFLKDQLEVQSLKVVLVNIEGSHYAIYEGPIEHEEPWWRAYNISRFFRNVRGKHIASLIDDTGHGGDRLLEITLTIHSEEWSPILVKLLEEYRNLVSEDTRYKSFFWREEIKPVIVTEIKDLSRKKKN